MSRHPTHGPATPRPGWGWPNIDRLASEGAMFANAFHAVPLCSPNRASLLTGQYPSRHGIIDNVARDRASHRLETFPRALRAAGYETAFVGKWHMGNDPTPRTGFDYWAAIPGQGRIIDPILYEDGRLHEVEGYVTDILTDRALSFVEQARDEPFFLFLSHKAIHPDARQLDDGSVDLDYPMVYIPARRHAGLYEGEVFPRRPNVPDDLGGLQSDAVRGALEARAAEAHLRIRSRDDPSRLSGRPKSGPGVACAGPSAAYPYGYPPSAPHSSPLPAYES